MNNDETKTSVPFWYWVVAVLAVLWNLMGCAALTMELVAQEAMMESWTDAQREWARGIPGWIYFVYAVAVAAGVVGSIGLLVRKSWSIPVYVTSLIAIVIQMVFTMYILGGVQIMGPSALVMPTLVIVFASALLWYSTFAKNRNWLT